MDELDELRNKAIELLLNVDIIRDCTYVNRDDFEQGTLEYEDLDYQDKNMLFTIDDFTVLNLKGDKNHVDKLIINFNGIHGDDPENFDDVDFYMEKYSDILEKNNNVSLINIIPLRTNRKETFLALFDRTEFNGIITFDYIINTLFKSYILPVINIIKPGEVLILDSRLKNSIKNVLESDTSIDVPPVSMFDDISSYRENYD
ncbi:hypothetical protein [Ferroplasma acidiphilum]|uniref:Uncharacterized protein n=1 Tax=Ferroplasma acidiphilum TaxID=74969 RepID=A0A7K4FPH1_9ARCH|nr:hypothetical protein [Ferroplasma acidiphilum]MCL4349546.1 hypothetical protein [Candidatus Thermoplasmatota archaeon]NOL60923.1 hypothetical protein [Ferroplasma acidiphilum]WMT53309.1 MAG: hypothetical protein RE473_00325 [Ferroplasma acidiphilum]